MRNSILLFLIIFSQNSFSQKLHENYMLFSNTKEYSEYIEFKNDSILTRKPYRSHLGFNISSTNSNENIFKDYKYKIDNDIITIFKFDKNDNSEYKIHSNQYLENSQKREIYILRSDFEETPKLAVIHKEKIYWLDSPKTSNGIILKKDRRNRKLSKILKNKTSENTDVNIYKGYNAYIKYGYRYVFGIIELKDKE